MVFAFNVGSKCGIMLPRELINQQVTPAKGLIVNRLIGNKSLVLVEEVWKFKGFPDSPLEEKCFPRTGRIKDSMWGWEEMPTFLKKDDYLIVPAEPENMMMPTETMFTAMIKKSIQDFKTLNSLV